MKKKGKRVSGVKKATEVEGEEARGIEIVNQIREILAEEPLLWGRAYLKHHFRLNSPSFHVELMQEAMLRQYLAIAAPRGSSKTTIVGFNYPFHAICHKKKRFIVYISNTFKQTTLMLYTIKQEIKENDKIIKDFGIQITKDAEDVSIFRHPDGFETMVLCLGAEQMGNIRGRKFGAYRPDLIIGDDIENDELVRNPERRAKLQEDFDNAVVPAGDIDTQYIVVGTILHDDSLMAKLISKDAYSEYHKMFFKGKYIDGDTKEVFSLWDEKMTIEWLNRYEKEKPHTFAREIQNDPSSSGTEEINNKDFRYWRIDNMQALLFDDEGNVEARYDLRDCKAAIACDLAWEDKQESDFTVLLPAFLTPKSDILIETYICRKGMRPNEFEEALFSMVDRLEAITGTTVPVGFEKAKLEKVAKWLLKQAMRRRNKYILLKDLEWGKEKIERIITKLQPRYAQHTIYHKRNMGDLETQLVRIRSTAHDDIADAAQGVCQLLQFPKAKKKGPKQTEDEIFMKLRKFANKDKFKNRQSLGQFLVGKRQYEIPAKQCPI